MGRAARAHHATVRRQLGRFAGEEIDTGSGLEFEDRGEHQLEGIEGPRRVFAAL